MRRCIAIVGIALCILQGQRVQGQVFRFGPGSNMPQYVPRYTPTYMPPAQHFAYMPQNTPHFGTPVRIAPNSEMARRESAGGLRDGIVSSADRAWTEADRKLAKEWALAHNIDKRFLIQVGLAVSVPVDGGVADENQAGAVGAGAAPNQADVLALLSMLQEQAEARKAQAQREADRATLVWPASLEATQFAADRTAADRLLRSWVNSPDGLGTFEKQRLRTALVNLRVKLKRNPMTLQSADFRVADAFLNSVAQTVIGLLARID